MSIPMPHKSADHAKGSVGKNRHTSYNEAGQLCMSVVDPATRKLMIPVSHILETRAQHRNTLPSLCQLFLTNRCRQGVNCYQVHASWEMVDQLRSEVDALPCCCVRHGDPDRAGVCLNAVEYAEFMHISPPYDPSVSATSDQGDTAAPTSAASAIRSLRDVVLYLPNCPVGPLGADGYVPLEHVSYTVALKRLLEEYDPLGLLRRGPAAHPAAAVDSSSDNASSAADPAAPTGLCPVVSLTDPTTGLLEEKSVMDATGCTVCRLHALDRCRYAEECKFLHVCKAISQANPCLTQSPARATTASTAREEGSAAHPARHPHDESDASFLTAMATSSEKTLTAQYGEAHSGKRTNPRHPHHHNNHGGISVFTAISRQQQQQQQLQQLQWGANAVAEGSSSFAASMGSPSGSYPTPAAAFLSAGSMGANSASLRTGTSWPSQPLPMPSLTTDAGVGGRPTLLIPQCESAAVFTGATTPAVHGEEPAFAPSYHGHGASNDNCSGGDGNHVAAGNSQGHGSAPRHNFGGTPVRSAPSSYECVSTTGGGLRVVVNCRNTAAMRSATSSASLPANASVPSVNTTPKMVSGKSMRTWQHNPYQCTRILPMEESTTTTSGSFGANQPRAGASSSLGTSLTSPLADYHAKQQQHAIFFQSAPQYGGTGSMNGYGHSL